MCEFVVSFFDVTNRLEVSDFRPESSILFITFYTHIILKTTLVSTKSIICNFLFVFSQFEMIDYEVVKCSQICSYMFFCNLAKQIQIKVINIVSHIHKMREWLNKRFCYYCFLQGAFYYQLLYIVAISSHKNNIRLFCQRS